MAWDLRMNQMRPAFSLLEILIVLSIIGILAAIGFRSFTSRSAQTERLAFVENLNALMSTAVDQAVFSGHLQRVHVDLIGKEIALQEQQDKDFKDLPKAQRNTHVEIPDSFEIQRFFINGQDEMDRSVSRATLWYFVVPDGLVQPVTVHIADRAEPEGYQFSLVLNPFSGQFTFHEGAIKP